MGTELEDRKYKYVRLPAFLELGFSDLKREVVSKRICTRCGTCVAFCDKIQIQMEAGDDAAEQQLPEFAAQYDTVCGLCYTFCPRTFLPLSELERRVLGRARAEDTVIGVYRSCYAVRTKREDISGQDGGAVTSLLAYALDTGMIDGAVITTSDEHWRPKTKVAKDFETLNEGAGTKYTLYPGVVGVKEAIEEGCNAIGFVGLPCQIQGLRKVQTAEQPYEVGKEKIKLVIGLFCMHNFTADLLTYIAKNYVELEKVKKVDIKGKEFLVYEEEGKVHAIPLDAIKEYIGEGCLSCVDYTAELADISAGSVGSGDGWTTVFARTELGEAVVNGAVENGYVEVDKIEDKGLALIRRLGKMKKRNAQS
ncbi:MAG: Coenzyme F420 hydrogenase/dehydrogenase, beta subunit C-terminal domain [Halobacteriota archaeon]